MCSREVNKYPTTTYRRPYTTLQNFCAQNRKLHCQEKRCHSFSSYISDNFASDFVIFGMLHRNGPSIQVGKYFSCLRNNADIIVTSVQHAVITAAIRQWRRRLSACVQANG